MTKSQIAKVNLDVRNRFGNTPFHVACVSGHEDLARFLVNSQQLNVDIEAENKNKNTPLHSA
eukprot:CAMPEP_0198128574 /NCGR_PEP_ID=MMETSP1442-20131203/49678_1 /TAXON_ID= /ORGANISM="Craspedostauros australis, Strain CCMP3328" /LENGTH=61 /DNA_ID=CAMNT_0043788767 /DNA_START=24 /DNA_END=206 /DNA_ORIENTATION=-